MELEGSLPHSLTLATAIYSMPPNPTSWRPTLILFSYLCLGFPSGLFPWGLATKTLYTPLLSPIRATRPAHLILLRMIFLSWYPSMMFPNIWIFPPFKVFITFSLIYVVFCPARWSGDMSMYLGFTAFTSRSISLLATTRASVFFFVVCMFLPNILTSSA